MSALIAWVRSHFWPARQTTATAASLAPLAPLEPTWKAETMNRIAVVAPSRLDDALENRLTPVDSGPGPFAPSAELSNPVNPDADEMSDPIGLVAAPPEPYADSPEHLRDELARIDLLVRAQTEIWGETLAIHKTYETAGVPYVSSGEVAAFLRQPFTLGPHLPIETGARVTALVEQSRERGWAIERRRALTPPWVELRLDRLQERCCLTDRERDVLLICLLPEVDPRYRRLFGYLLDDASRAQPTVELVLGILHPLADPLPERGSEFDASGPLAAQALVVLGGDGRGDTTLPTRSVRLDDRIAGYLLGRNEIDDRLEGILAPATEAAGWDDFVLPPAELEQLVGLAEWWVARKRTATATATLLFHGPYGSGRRMAARAICATTGTSLLFVDVAAAVRSAVGWDRIVALAYREALLRDAAICWVGCEEILDEAVPGAERLLTAAETFPGLTYLTTKTAWDPAGRFHQTPLISVGFTMPSYALRRELWAALLPADDDLPRRQELADALANGFQLTPGRMRDALATATWQAARRDPAHPVPTRADLYEGCRRQSGRRLMALATRIEKRESLDFDDLILPPVNKRHLAELQARLRDLSRVRTSFENRLSLGQGCVVLFTGGSGTGKTMAAELLARDQGADLFKVDLSAVVSKWVGETEKNLNRVFAEAADANAILFFDEADALFGQRGPVKDPQDRWANMEVNYLLQRVEEYAGVVILASNLRQNIDEAFMRRVQVAVDFPFPEADARLEIVRGLLPPGIDPPPETALATLTERFKLPGGSWKNIVVDAMFRATDECGDGCVAITSRHLVLAIAREYQKLGKPLTRGEFGDEHFRWVEEDIL